MNTTSRTSQRRNDLDWLRLFAILVVFFYHTSRFFNLEDWHIKNPSTYFGVEVWNSFATIWMMPLIFVISGASLYFGLEKGGAGRFVKDKVLRLFVPLLVGAFTHASLQVYLDRLTHGQFSGSYFQFLPHYFEGVYLPGEGSGNFAFHGMHLWYLLVLFLFSLIFYPLLRWLKGNGRNALHRMDDPLALPGGIYLLALPVILFLATGLLDDLNLGGWSLLPYACFFLGGFVIISHERVQAQILRLRWISLVLALALTVVGLSFSFPGVWSSEPAEIWFFVLEGLAAWSWILAFFGFAMQRLTFSTPALKYANDAVLPFYILHQTVLLLVGYFVVGWSIPDPLKYVVIAAISFAVIIGIYEYLIRRNNLMRFLFGMKPAAREREARPVLSARPG
jgi:peptidoglycan/LPS O-acetylase OafA/YrhL